jgi:hypothetical protein
MKTSKLDSEKYGPRPGGNWNDEEAKFEKNWQLELPTKRGQSMHSSSAALSEVHFIAE